MNRKNISLKVLKSIVADIYCYKRNVMYYENVLNFRKIQLKERKIRERQ